MTYVGADRVAGDVEPRASVAEKFRVTVNDKILVHLLDYVRYAEKPEAPREVTQQGIAEVHSARRSHISLAVNTLRERGHLEERTMRITDEVRRRKAYFLTPKGCEAGKRLTASFHARTVRVEDASGVRDVPIGKLSEVLGEKYYLVDILCCTSREGILDLAQLTGQQAAPEAPPPRHDDVPVLLRDPRGPLRARGPPRRRLLELRQRVPGHRARPGPGSRPGAAARPTEPRPPRPRGRPRRRRRAPLPHPH